MAEKAVENMFDRLHPMFAVAGSVYASLARHQTSEAWYGRDLVATFQIWANRFIAQFKLEIPEVTLRVDALRVTCYGHFRYGYNGLGLKGEIAINARYLFTGQREEWQILGTLLHELLHAWQQAHGKPGKGNYHNREFRNKAASLGLIIDKRGATGYLAESPFKDLLRQYEVSVPTFQVPLVTNRIRGESKLKKWTCGCPVAGWFGRAEVPWNCPECGQKVRRADVE